MIDDTETIAALATIALNSGGLARRGRREEMRKFGGSRPTATKPFERKADRKARRKRERKNRKAGRN